jgi:hypothetical protein
VTVKSRNVGFHLPELGEEGWRVTGDSNRIREMFGLCLKQAAFTTHILQRGCLLLDLEQALL